MTLAVGHTTIAITLDTYSHMLPAIGDRTARAMQDALTPIEDALTASRVGILMVYRGPGSASRPSLRARKMLLFAGNF